MEHSDDILKSIFITDEKFSSGVKDLETKETRLALVEKAISNPETSANDQRFLEDERRTLTQQIAKLKKEMEEDLQETPNTENYPHHEG